MSLEQKREESLKCVDLYPLHGHLVILGIPSGTDFGIDCKVYETGPEFRGVKLVPPGLHFVIYGARGGGGRQGFFFEAKPGEVAVRSWDPGAEDLTQDSGLSDEAFSKLQEAVHRFELDGSMGPYPKNDLGSWKSLSNWITEAVLKTTDLSIGSKILPGVDDLDDLETQQSQNGPPTQVTPFFEGVGRAPRFFDVKGGKVLNKDLSVEDRTMMNMDKTRRLLEILRDEFQGDEGLFLGQVQLSFLLFLQLLSLPALRHWECLIHLVCHSHNLAGDKPAFLAGFIQVLLPQLSLLPEDFFAADISKYNFLGPAFSDLFQNLEEPALNSQLHKSLTKLLEYVKERFGLFTSDRSLPPGMTFCLNDEDLPTVVSDISGMEIQSDSEAVSQNGNGSGSTLPEKSDTGKILANTTDNQSVVNRWQAIDEALSSINKPFLSDAKSNQDSGEKGESDTAMELSGPDSDDEAELLNDLPLPPSTENTIKPLPQGLEKKYPKLYQCIDPALNEDIFMAAARIISPEFEPDSTFKALAKTEAQRFLENEVQQSDAEVNQSLFWEKEMKRNDDIYDALRQKPKAH